MTSLSSGSSVSIVGNQDNKTVRTRNVDKTNIRPYLRRILSHVEPGIRISSNAISKLDELIRIVIQKIIKGSDRVAKYGKVVTISPDEIDVTTEIILHQQLAQGAVDAGRRAVDQYKNTAISRGIRSPTKGRKSSDIIEQPNIKRPESFVNGLTSPRERRNPIRRSNQAGLTMDVSRMGHLIRQISQNQRLSADAPVFLAGVIEYLTIEIYRKSIELTRKVGRSMIRHREFIDALYVHPGLSELSGDWLFNEITKLGNSTDGQDGPEETEEVESSLEIPD